MKSAAPQALAIRLSSLGDIVLCSAFVKRWQALHPGGQLTFATSERFASILGFFPAPLRLVQAPRRGLLRFWWSGWRAQKGHSTPDFCIYDLQGSLKSRAFISGFRWAMLLKTQQWPRVLKTPRKSWQRHLSVWLRQDRLGPRKIYEEHQRLLSPDHFATPELQTRAHPGPRKNFLLAPDSQHWKKKIPEDICESIATDLLLHSSENIHVVGGENVLSPEFFRRLEKNFPGRVRNDLGKTKIEDLPSLASQHRFVVCGNSAWLHIAEAVDTPVLSFAGPIVEGFGFSPWHPRSHELTVSLACRPCTRHGGGRCHQTKENFHACVRHADWQKPLRRMLRELV